MPKYGKKTCPSIHEHELELKSDETPFICNGCKEPGFNVRYTCPKKKCDFHLHKACALDFGSTVTTTVPFSKNNFTFQMSLEREEICEACGKLIRGFVYHSLECNTKLHPCCADLPRSIQTDKLDVKLELKSKIRSKCDRCNEKKIKGVKTWAYVTNSTPPLNLHISCVSDVILEQWEKLNLHGTKEVEHQSTGKKIKRTLSNIIFRNKEGGDHSGSKKEKSSVLCTQEVGDHSGVKKESNDCDLTKPSGSGSLRVILPKGKKQSWTISNITKIIKMVMSIIIGVLLGDPYVGVSQFLISLVPD